MEIYKQKFNSVYNDLKKTAFDLLKFDSKDVFDLEFINFKGKALLVLVEDLMAQAEKNGMF